jgi:hypothetical protein
VSELEAQMFNLALNSFFRKLQCARNGHLVSKISNIPESESSLFVGVILIIGTCFHEASVCVLIAIGMVYRETYSEVSQTAVSVMTAIPEVDSED